jgi:aminocarboxymuconate-semialdehyde decarboxylase
MKSIVIDVHAHFTPKLLIEKFDGAAAKFPDVKLLKSDKGVAIQFPGIAPTRPIMPKLSDLAERQSWMDKNGIDHQVIGGWLDSFGYELPAAQGAAWSRFLNDCMWEQFRDERRFSPLATVPLQDGKLAAEVLEESMAKGFAGAMVGTLPHGEHGGNLDDPSLDPFWETASKLKAAIVMHPMFVCGEQRLADYDLVNGIGRLVDSSIAVSRLLFSGHILKYSGMKFMLSHGGAALPYGLGRLARSHVVQAGKVADPRKGFAAMYFDTCIFDSDSLDYLVQKAGVDHVMLGSDAPFPIGDPEPLKVFKDAKLTEAQKNTILSATAQAVFKVRADAWTRG